jgi:beta-lactamase regulating signal transducer with metallopeptidase domain
MHPLLHSPFLQALGYTIINSLWQFALLWLLYFLINTIFKLSSHQKYTTGLVFEIIGFAWFVGTLIFYYNQCLLLPEQNAAISQSHFPLIITHTGTSFSEQCFIIVLGLEQFFPYLSIAYLALLFMLTVKWIFAYRFTQQVRFAGLAEIEEDWRVFVQKLSSQLGISRPVHIFLSELVQTPLTVGFFKPVILIPLATINYLSTQQMEAVILHELAHIRRFDYLFNLILALIEACLFFNPFMQLIHQQIKKERENCCDDWVLRYDYSATSYARALLQIASNQSGKQLLSLNATDDKKVLISRIKRIIEKNERTFFNHKHQLLALLVLTTVFSFLSVLTPSKKTVRASTLSGRSNVVFQSMAAKVKNPLFNPVFFLANTPENAVEITKKPAEVKPAKTKTAISRIAESVPPQTVGKPESLMSVTITEDSKLAEAPAVTDPLTEAKALSFTGSLNLAMENWSKNQEYFTSQEKTGKWFSEEAFRQMEIAKKDLQKVQRETMKEKDVLNLEKVRVQVASALKQIKFSNKKLELSKLKSLVQLGIKEIQKEKITSILPDINIFKLSELELLEKQLEKEMSSLKQPMFYTTALTDNIDYNFRVPAAVYTPSAEKEHTFSFQFSTRPGVRVISAQSVQEFKKEQKKMEKTIVTDTEEDDIIQTETNAPTPPRPARVRSTYIIKI